MTSDGATGGYTPCDANGRIGPDGSPPVSPAVPEFEHSEHVNQRVGPEPSFEFVKFDHVGSQTSSFSNRRAASLGVSRIGAPGASSCVSLGIQLAHRMPEPHIETPGLRFLPQVLHSERINEVVSRHAETEA